MHGAANRSHGSEAGAVLGVAAVTSGRFVPSSRFRVRQHIRSLRHWGIQVLEYTPAISKYARIPGWPEGVRQLYTGPLFLASVGARLAARVPGIVGSWKHQVTWLEREMLPGVPTLEGLLKRPLVLDVDDAVWLYRPMGRRAMRRIAQRAAVVVAGNHYLAEWFSRYCQDVREVPTAIDVERFRPADRPADDRPFTIGWTGLASNLPYLQMIEEPLRRFLRSRPDVRLVVVADRPPTFLRRESAQLRFIPWTAGVEVEAVQAMDVGLMPLPDNAWTRGKCSYKMLQYMACGIPVIASSVGMNAEVFALAEIGLPATRTADWYDALESLYRDREQAREYGRQGRGAVERHFACRVISAKLAAIFRELAA